MLKDLSWDASDELYLTTVTSTFLSSFCSIHFSFLFLIFSSLVFDKHKHTEQHGHQPPNISQHPKAIFISIHPSPVLFYILFLIFFLSF